MAFALTEAFRGAHLFRSAAGEHAPAPQSPPIDKVMKDYARERSKKLTDPTIKVLRIESDEPEVHKFLYREGVFTSRSSVVQGKEVLVKIRKVDSHETPTFMVKYREAGEFVDVTRLPAYKEQFGGRDGTVSPDEQFRFAARVTHIDRLSPVKVRIF